MKFRGDSNAVIGQRKVPIICCFPTVYIYMWPSLQGAKFDAVDNQVHEELVQLGVAPPYGQGEVVVAYDCIFLCYIATK